MFAELMRLYVVWHRRRKIILANVTNPLQRIVTSLGEDIRDKCVES